MFTTSPPVVVVTALRPRNRHGPQQYQRQHGAFHACQRPGLLGRQGSRDVVGVASRPPPIGRQNQPSAAASKSSLNGPPDRGI
jgi:hypothetical protein